MTIAREAPFAPLRMRHLFDLDLRVPAVVEPGGPAGMEQRVGMIGAGEFSGERFSGRVVPGGDDWQTLRADGAAVLDARIVLRTGDEACIGMVYRGIRHGPAGVMDRLARGEAVDPGEYYFRVSARFTTSDPRYAWLNRIVAAGSGHRFPEGPRYSIYEIA